MKSLVITSLFNSTFTILVLSSNHTLASSSTSMTATFPTPTPTGDLPPTLELLSPQPVKIYGIQGTLNIQIIATFAIENGSIVIADSSLLAASLISSAANVVINIPSYDAATGQLVLPVPSEFFDYYVNAAINSTYFNITLTSPVSSLVSSIAFAAEYLDVVNVTSIYGRDTFAIGEEIALRCNTIPPYLPVTWEFISIELNYELVDAQIQYEPPSHRTVLRLMVTSISERGRYFCRGTDQLVNETSSGIDVDIIPETLSIHLSYMVNNGPTEQMYLVNRSAFVLPSQFIEYGGSMTLLCIGVLESYYTEIMFGSVITTIGVSTSNYVVFRGSLYGSGDFVGITFYNFLNSNTGYYTCRSRNSASDKTVVIAKDTVAMLLSSPTVRVTEGQNATFVYRIALADDVNVLQSVKVVITNLELSGTNLSIIVDLGNDIYEVIFPTVSSILDQVRFVLQINQSTVTGTAHIAVLPYNIVVNPEEFAVTSVGEDVQLQCTPTNTSIPIVWYKGIELLHSSSKHTFSPVGLQHTLTINDSQICDSGNYYCTFYDGEIRDDLRIKVFVIEEPVAIILNGVAIPRSAVINDPEVPPQLTMMCVGTEGNRRLVLHSSSSTLPNPVIPGIYQSTDNPVLYSMAEYDNVIMLSVSNITHLQQLVGNESYVCESLQSSATATLYITNATLFVQAHEESIQINYGQPVNILYTVAFFSNGTENLNNTVLELTIGYLTSEDSSNPPLSLDLNLLSVVSGNQYQLTVPFAISGVYSLFAQLPQGNASSTASVYVAAILPQLSVEPRMLYELMGYNVSFNCTMSFPDGSAVSNIPVTWFYGNERNFTDASSLNNADFLPQNLKHTILLQFVDFSDAGTYICAIVQNGARISEMSVELLVFPNLINVGYNYHQTFLPYWAVINQLDAIPAEASGILTLTCFTVTGQEYPEWRRTGIYGRMLPNLTAGDTTITNQYQAATLTFNRFEPRMNGYYYCNIPPYGPSVLLVLTTSDPYVNRVDYSPLYVRQCNSFTLAFQVALSSDGFSNAVETVRLEQFRNGESVTNYTLTQTSFRPQYIYTKDFMALSSSAGEYFAYLAEYPNENDSIEVIITYPTLSLLTNNTFTVFRGDNVTFQCIPSNLSLPIQWRLYNTERNDVIITPDVEGQDNTITSSTQFETPTPGLFHQITLFNISLSANGTFSCELLSPCSDVLVIAKNISLTVIPACNEVIEVVLWPKTPISTLAMIRCADIDSSFQFGPYITRRCNEEEMWDSPDFSQCTVRDGSHSLLVVSVQLEVLDAPGEIPNAMEIERMILDYMNSNEGVTVMVGMYKIGYFVSVAIQLPVGPVNNITVSDLQDYFNSYAPFGEFSVIVPPKFTVFKHSDTCYCYVAMGNDDGSGDSERSTTSALTFVDVCVGPAVAPCLCDTFMCRCNAPAFSGNGTLCARDSDGDTIPDIGLDCDGILCEKDLCPTVFSLLQDGTQDRSVCTVTSIQDELRCPMEADKFGLIWPVTVASTMATISCPRGIGMSTRYCNAFGEWQPSNVTMCRSYDYVAISMQAQEINTMQPQQAAEMSADTVNYLAAITEQTEGVSTLPLDLGSTVDIINTVISIATTSGAIEQDEFVNDVVQVYNNILNATNTPGWIALQEINRTQGQVLLMNAEQFSFQMANALNVSQANNRTIAAENIVISVEAVDVRNDENITDFLWPSADVLEQTNLFKGSIPSVSILIPGDLIQKRGVSSENGMTFISNVVYQNFESVLPSANISRDANIIQPASLVLTSQVSTQNTSALPLPSDSNPVVLTFNYSMIDFKEVSNLTCGFWDFDLDQGSNASPGGWSSAGLSIETLTNATIKCFSRHLTSFAVLVDVSGASQTATSAVQRKALSIVTYIGCGISLICLIMSIILFIIYRNSLLKGIHNFVHLNLSIALATALLAFVAGIESAKDNKVGCTIVAALLHYFFTAVLSWMLCEGIIIYFMLVKIFNTGLGHNNYFYLAIGWGTPLPVVAIAVGVAHDHYGTDDYCWISTSGGVIWAFVVPMLAIILVNLGFIALAFRAIFVIKKSKADGQGASNSALAIALMKATLILLPLLGTTWIFGVFAVNEESVAFAWIFTILNSLQGAFIFVFHVLRNEKIKNKMKSYFGKGSKYSTNMIAGESSIRTSSRGRTKKVLMTKLTNKPGSSCAVEFSVINSTSLDNDTTVSKGYKHIADDLADSQAI